MVQTSTLVKIAAGGAVAICTAGLLMERNIKKRFTKTPQYTISMEALQTHRGALGLLGEPIKALPVNLGDDDIYLDQERAVLKIPIIGSIKKGLYHSWVERDEDRWIITRAELGFDDEPDKRLVIVKAFELEKKPKNSASSNNLEYLNK